MPTMEDDEPFDDWDESHPDGEPQQLETTQSEQRLPPPLPLAAHSTARKRKGRDEEDER